MKKQRQMGRECWPEEKVIQGFETALRRQERSSGTIEKYVRDVRAFGRWLNEQGLSLCSETAGKWKTALLEQGYQVTTINSMVCAVNSFFRYIGREDLHIHTMRVQRKLFWETERELSQKEFQKLVLTARREGRDKLALLMETIAGTGIRISELCYITVESAKKGRATINLKGKLRVILLSEQIRKRLCDFAKKQHIMAGPIFCTRRGTAFSRKQIWAEMKALAERAGVALSKVFPHNLRHLFARCFYREWGDLVTLANLLGHSSMETTRLYLLTTQASQQKKLDRIHLLC